ncbi:GNAT family protein [Desulfosporosinus sp. PR]|uniref:GNAT family N-acetyltransferase n=1 Tax=Candidatus Desulfosporosinus nitrosoreducens TaxID=3401928 RepID=UPI0027E7D8C0|nr:GNAT family protein [Desulfosporosinus sp. PR]MDQ7094454.1 GNAT family protein [Desulfosporosinus sp. PR]
MTRIETLETDRLFIRELDYKDFDDIHRIKSNEEVVRYITWGPNDEIQTRKALDKQIGFQEDLDRTKYVLGIVLKSIDQLIGNGLMSIKDNETGEIGYFFHPEYWGKGFGTETGRALIKFGFAKLNLHRIIAMCDVENAASIKILKKLGMRQEGHFIKDQKIRGVWRDNLLFALIREEYQYI